MIEREKVKKIIEERKQLHPDDPSVEKYWAKLTEMFTINEQATIGFLNNSDTEEITWISEVFEDISAKLQSKNFISCIENIAQRNPELNISHDIEFAKKSLVD